MYGTESDLLIEVAIHETFFRKPYVQEGEVSAFTNSLWLMKQAGFA